MLDNKFLADHCTRGAHAVCACEQTIRLRSVRELGGLSPEDTVLLFWTVHSTGYCDPCLAAAMRT